MRNHASGNATTYKAKAKVFRDSHIIEKKFNVGQNVLLFYSNLKLFSSKLRFKWAGLFVVVRVYSHGVVDIQSLGRYKVLKVNEQPLK